MAISTVEKPRTKCARRINIFWAGHSRAEVVAASARKYGLAPQLSVTASSSSAKIMGTFHGHIQLPPDSSRYVHVGFPLKGTQRCTGGYLEWLLL